MRRRCFVRDFEFWTVQKFSDAQLRVSVRNSSVGMRSLCVEYAWLCVGHSSAVSAYASEVVRNRARPRSSTDISRMNGALITIIPLTSTDNHLQKVLVRGTFTKRACLDDLCQWFMRRACVECSWNTVVNFSTHKHAQTQSVRYLWVIRAWSAVWLDLKFFLQFYSSETMHWIFLMLVLAIYSEFHQKDICLKFVQHFK